jgi:hypothetical protein
VNTRTVSLLALAAVLLPACIDQGFSEIKTRDRFQQNRRNAVDLLVVIDNSCSMVEEQDNLARNFDALISTFTAADVDWQLAVTTTDTEVEQYRGLLMGGDDEIILRTSAGELDAVRWTRDWRFTEGVSLQLDPAKYKWNSNDTVGNWCDSTAAFADQKGTPGEWNTDCSGSAVTPPVPESDEGPRTPPVGAVVLTEVMASSSGVDSLCEWFELTNVTDDTLDLSNLSVTDLGRNAVSLPEGTELEPYGVLVVGRSTDTSQNCGTPVDVAFAEGLTLAEDVRVIDTDTEDANEMFQELVAQGTIGTGIEMGLEAARLVFEEPYWTEENKDLGFLRGDYRVEDDGLTADQEANLSVLFVSDEEDLSPLPAAEYVRYFTDLKGQRAYRDRSIVNLSAVIGKDPPPREDYPACESDNGIAYFGEKYIAAVNETQGLIESICEPDFAPIISKLGLTLSGLSADFELSEYPQLETLTVKLYETDDTDSFVRDLQCGVDFTYVADSNVLHFEEEQLPPSQYIFVAEYEVRATPNTSDEGCGLAGSEE